MLYDRVVTYKEWRHTPVLMSRDYILWAQSSLITEVTVSPPSPLSQVLLNYLLLATSHPHTYLVFFGRVYCYTVVINYCSNTVICPYELWCVLRRVGVWGLKEYVLSSSYKGTSFTSSDIAVWCIISHSTQLETELSGIAMGSMAMSPWLFRYYL